MRKLVIGNTIIEYSIRESEKARLKRIVIRPETVTVIVPKGTPENNISAFIEKHKSRIFFKRKEQLQNVEEKNAEKSSAAEKPQAYVTGVKILHYGRMTGLITERRDVPFVSIEARSRIHVQVPSSSTEDEVRQAIENWQRNRIMEDASAFVEQYGYKLNLFPQSIRIKEQKHLWASCGKDKIINLNRKLINFPKAVLEYVVVHELCHLKYRNHSKEFWRLVGSVFSDWQTCKRILEQ